MKQFIWAVVFFVFPCITFAGSSVNVPWQEFKELYRESIEKTVREENQTIPFVYSIHSSEYTVNLRPGSCEGTLNIQGVSVSGNPEPFPLFNTSLIINDIKEVTGGSLLSDQKKNKGVCFFPDNLGKFQIKLTFFLPVRDDTRSKFVSMDIPGSLKNSLHVQFSDTYSLLEVPGMKDQNGTYVFPSQKKLLIRYSHHKQITQKEHSQNYLKHYKTVITPPTVLETLSCYSSFEENGNVLSVLVMDVPKEAGAYLKVKSIPNTKIWGLKVNHENRKLYTNEQADGFWVIPLSKNKSSHVEIAMIRHGDKLGLQGRLETSLPAMEFAARFVTVAIALPKRVDLISYEGPLSSASKAPVYHPKEFVGRPYYFSRSFYQGEGMKVAIMYKEPVR